MTAAFEAGAVFGGNSAGDAVQSRDMINGYYGSNGPAESIQQGAVQVCYDSGPTRLRGRPAVRLPEPHHRPARVRVRPHRPLAQRRRLETGKPVLGMDAATGAVVTDYTHLRDVTGDTLGYVIDPNAYAATGDLRRPERHARRAQRRDAPAAVRLRVRLLDDDAAARSAPRSLKPSIAGRDLPGVHHRRHGRAAVPRGRRSSPTRRLRRRRVRGGAGGADAPGSSCSPRATTRAATRRPTPRRSPPRSRRTSRRSRGSRSTRARRPRDAVAARSTARPGSSSPAATARW